MMSCDHPPSLESVCILDRVFSIGLFDMVVSIRRVLAIWYCAPVFGGSIGVVLNSCSLRRASIET